jgi:hypothetical protein
VRFHDETPEIASLYSAVPHKQSIITGNPEYRLALGEEERPDDQNVQQSIQSFATAALTPVPARVAESHSPSISSLSSPRSIQSRSSSKPLHLLTEREAVLMRNFVENMALWVCIYLAATRLVTDN